MLSCRRPKDEATFNLGPETVCEPSGVLCLQGLLRGRGGGQGRPRLQFFLWCVVSPGGRGTGVLKPASHTRGLKSQAAGQALRDPTARSPGGQSRSSRQTPFSSSEFEVKLQKRIRHKVRVSGEMALLGFNWEQSKCVSRSKLAGGSISVVCGRYFRERLSGCPAGRPLTGGGPQTTTDVTAPQEGHCRGGGAR